MKKTLLLSLALAGTLAATSAHASDTAVGAVVGGSVGGLIGHSMGGRDGAVVGGLVGALAGAALASNRGPRYVNNGYGRSVHYENHHAPAYYGARPVPVYYAAPSAHIHRMERRYQHSAHRHSGWEHQHGDQRYWR